MDNKTLKRLDIRVEMEGQGGINYDDDSQKWFLRDHCGRNIYTTVNGQTKVKENVKYLKKAFYKKENCEEGEGEFDYYSKISANCLRREIFPGCCDADSVIWMFPKSAVKFITSPEGFSHGYMNPVAGNNGFGKSTCLNVLDAIDKNAVIAEEVCTKTGERDSTSLHYKENVGETHYSFEACFEVENAQFLCCDDFSGRIAIDPSYIEGENLYEQFMIEHYSRVPYVAGVYSNKTQILGKYYGEYGFLFDDEYVNSLIKSNLKHIFGISIERSGAWTRTKKVEIRPVYDPLNVSDDDWVVINPNDIDSLNFNIHHFYEEASQHDWEERANVIKVKREEEAKKKEKKREEEKKKKENKKNEQKED